MHHGQRGDSTCCQAKIFWHSLIFVGSRCAAGTRQRVHVNVLLKTKRLRIVIVLVVFFWILRSDRYVETTTESSVMNHDELICLTNVTLDEEHAVFGFYLFQQAFHCHSLIPSRHSQFRSTKSLCSFIQFTSLQFAFTRCFGLRDLRRNWLV